MSPIYKKRLYNKKLKRKVDLNNGFYKGYFSKEGKGLYKVDNSFKGEVITTGNFTPLELGDIVIIKNNGEHYITVIEEVV